MDDKFRGFCSETFTLIIGPEAKELFVPKDILVQIPYFNSALSSGQYIESKEKTFKLPEDDPQAVANVIYFVYTNHVKKLDRATPTTIEEVQEVGTYVKAYIVADKFTAETTANRLLDELFEYHRYRLVCPKVIARLSTAGLENSDPYEVFIEHIAYSLKHDHYPETTPGETSQAKIQYDWEGVCAQLEKEDLLRMIAAFKRVKYSGEEPIETAVLNRCMFHKHDLTEKCKPTRTATPASRRRRAIQW